MKTDTQKSPTVRIGTSGWYYRHWVGPFYPHDLPAKAFFSYYVRHFQTVEINNSFYRVPEKETFQQWRETSPDGFLFSVKANRFITHRKKLKDAEKPVQSFILQAEALGHKLGPILFQLPPKWRVNPDRLDVFLQKLPAEHRYTFEFRDSSWFTEEVVDILADYGAAFCIYELNRTLSPLHTSADFVYIRLHGPEGAYQGMYGEGALKKWAERIHDWTGEGRDVYCYFDNDQAGYAAADAKDLIALIQDGENL